MDKIGPRSFASVFAYELRCAIGRAWAKNGGMSQLKLAAPASTEQQQKPGHLFRPGESGNPRGRPNGSRNKLSDAFIADLHADWLAHGPEAITRVRETMPHVYLRVVVAIANRAVPRSSALLGELSDNELEAGIAYLRALGALKS